MINLCLDQCAISKLATRKTKDATIGELKRLLIEASEKNSLVCPIASETIAETTALPSECRIRLHDLHTYLAGARNGGPRWAFKDMWKMINEETLALARSEPPPHVFDLIHWRRIGDDRLASEKASDLRNGKRKMCERVQPSKFDPIQGCFERDTAKLNFDLEHVSHVFRQINRLLADEALHPDDHMGYELAKYLEEQGIEKPQLEKLAQDIIYHRWESIPVIFNRTQLTRQLEKEYISIGNARNYRANDEFDIPRIAVGLASSDIIITDASMANLCSAIKTERWTKTKVFAVRDTAKIIKHLERVLA